MRSKAPHLLLSLLAVLITPASTVPLGANPDRAILEVEGLDEPSAKLAMRQYQPFVYTCSGYPGASPAGDGGCGGPCTKQYVSSPTVNSCPSGSVPSGTYVPNTNCIDTDGNTPFYVCDGDNSCNPYTSFHPTQDKEGRFIYNTRGTMYLYVTSC